MIKYQDDILINLPYFVSLNWKLLHGRVFVAVVKEEARAGVWQKPKGLLHDRR